MPTWAQTVYSESEQIEEMTVEYPDGAIKLLYGITYETAVAGVILLILMQEKVSIELTGSGLMNTAGC